MNNTLKVNNETLRDYFEVIGVLPRKQYENEYNTNIAHVGQDGFVRFLTSVNENNDSIYTWCQDEHREKYVDNFDFSINVNSNDMKDYLEVFDKDENKELKLDKKFFDNNEIEGVLIETEDTTLSLAAIDKYCYEYPSDESTKTQIYIDANDFVNGVENVIKSIATKEPYMPTICCLSIKLDKENNVVELAGIDGFRLSTKKISVTGINQESDDREQFLIKKCTVNSMLKMVKKIKSLKRKNFNPDLTLTFTNNTVFCESNGYFLNAKLGEGNFFDYESIKLKEKKTQFTTNRDNLLKELKKLSKIKQEKQNLVKLDISEDSVYLTSRNETAECCIDYSKNVKEHSGEELTIGFNTSYLIDAIEKLDKKQEVNLSFDNHVSPIQIEYSDKNNNSGLNLVLPVRLTH